MVRPHAACRLKRLEAFGGIPAMDKFVNGLPDDLTFSVSQNLTEPRNRSAFLLCDIYLSSNHTSCCIYSGAGVNANARWSSGNYHGREGREKRKLEEVEGRVSSVEGSRSGGLDAWFKECLQFFYCPRIFLLVAGKSPGQKKLLQ